MNLDVDSSKVMYFVGGLLGVVTILYFGAEIIVDMSPTLKSMVLLMAFAFFLVAAQRARSGSLDSVLYVLSAGSYIVFLWYTVSRFDLTENHVFLLLGASSLLFIGLGYAFREEHLDIDDRRARIGMAVLVVLAMATVAGDALGAQPAAETEFDESFSLEEVQSPGDRVVVGELTVTNDFPFSRYAEPPRHRGCLYPGGESFVLSRADERGYSSSEMLLAGGSERSFGLTAPASAFYDRETDELEAAFEGVDEIPIETADGCPEDGEEPKLVVVEDGERGPVPVRR